MRKERLLNLSLMARRLGVRPRDLRAAVDSGEIPTIRVGESLLFDPIVVEQALAQRSQVGEGVNDE